MPEPVVEARLAASQAAVLASLTTFVAGHGGSLEGVDDYGSVVTWCVFDGRVDLVTLRAEIGPDDEPGITRLVVRRVDAALEAVIDSSSSAEKHGFDARDAG